eukprot:3404903-Pleurochrysis_carterae.AAC.2
MAGNASSGNGANLASLACDVRRTSTQAEMETRSPSAIMRRSESCDVVEATRIRQAARAERKRGRKPRMLRRPSQCGGLGSRIRSKEEKGVGGRRAGKIQM